MATKSSRKKGLVAMPVAHKPLPEKAASATSTARSPQCSAPPTPSHVSPATSAANTPSPSSLGGSANVSPARPTDMPRTLDSGGIIYQSVVRAKSPQPVVGRPTVHSGTTPPPQNPAYTASLTPQRPAPPPPTLESFEGREDVNPNSLSLDNRYSKSGRDWETEVKSIFGSLLDEQSTVEPLARATQDQNQTAIPPPVNRGTKPLNVVISASPSDLPELSIESDDEDCESDDEQEITLPYASLTPSDYESMTSEMDQEGKAEPAEDDEFDGEIDDLRIAMIILQRAKKTEQRGEQRLALEEYREGLDKLHEVFLENADPSQQEFVRTLLTYHCNRAEELRIQVQPIQTPRMLSASGSKLPKGVQTSQAFKAAETLAKKARELDNNEMVEQAIDVYSQSVDELKRLAIDPEFEEDRQAIAGKILIYERRMVDLLKYRKYPKKVIPAPYSHAVAVVDNTFSKTGLGQKVQNKFESEFEKNFVKEDPEYADFKAKRDEKRAEKELKKFYKSKEGKKQLKREKKEAKMQEKQEAKDAKLHEKQMAKEAKLQKKQESKKAKAVKKGSEAGRADNVD